MSLHPMEGARYLFELNAPTNDESSARYRVTVYTPDESFEGTAVMTREGAVEQLDIHNLDGALEKNARAIARTLAKAAARNAAADLPPWPRRVLRWRGPGRGT